MSQKEVEFLQRWINANWEVTKRWPGDRLAARVEDFLQDGYLDPEESIELLDLLRDFTAYSPELIEPSVCSSALPLNNPLPPIVFERSAFCFTGRFAFGTREQCESDVENLGGYIDPQPIAQTDYLVIGIFGSRDWIHSAYGRKIERAIELREQKYPIAIVSEDHWTEHLTMALDR